MKRHRPETTFYLGDKLYRELENYRHSLPIPPSASALIREALRRFLDEARDNEGQLAPPAWVEATEILSARLVAQGVSVGTDEILRALDSGEEERVADILGDGR